MPIFRCSAIFTLILQLLLLDNAFYAVSLQNAFTILSPGPHQFLLTDMVILSVQFNNPVFALGGEVGGRGGGGSYFCVRVEGQDSCAKSM